MNFFRVLRDETDSLIRAILGTPYSRAEYELAWESTEDSLEQARRYYVRSWQGWSGGKSARSAGWRIQYSSAGGKSVIKDWNTVEHLRTIVRRLKQAFIENDDALAIIDRYDQSHTLFYLDPPYLAETRNKRWRENAYQHEIDTDYHRRLLDKLLAIQGMAIISGYPSDLYTERLADWRRVETTARTTNTSNTVTEILWLSPSVMANGQPLLLPLEAFS